MQVVIQLQTYEIIDELIDAHATGRTHVFRSEFDFRLTLEYRFLYVNGNRSDNTVTDVGELLVLIKELLDCTSYRFAISRLVGTALDCMLTIDERVVFIAVLISMGQRDLNIFAYDVNDRIERIDGHILRQQVEQTVLAHEAFAIIDEC